MILNNLTKQIMVKAEDALIGREQPIEITNCHQVTRQPIQGPFDKNLQQYILARPFKKLNLGNERLNF